MASAWGWGDRHTDTLCAHLPCSFEKDRNEDEEEGEGEGSTGIRTEVIGSRGTGGGGRHRVRWDSSDYCTRTTQTMRISLPLSLPGSLQRKWVVSPRATYSLSPRRCLARGWCYLLEDVRVVPGRDGPLQVQLPPGHSFSLSWCSSTYSTRTTIQLWTRSRLGEADGGGAWLTLPWMKGTRRCSSWGALRPLAPHSWQRYEAKSFRCSLTRNPLCAL